jgi:predicted ArsR family transcriptional regulator
MRPIRGRWDLRGLSARSVALCGSEHRLPVAIVIAEAERNELYAAAVARAAGITRMEATRQFEALRHAGLLVPAGRQRSSGAGRPAALFARTDRLGWAGLVALGARYRLAGE